jgi:hypothetical protein
VNSNVHVTIVQMPAVNTPQFSWVVLSRLPNQAQPSTSPRWPARAVAHAADHPTRGQHWVGGSTMGTLAGNAIAPGLLDRYLARTGFKSQQTDQPRDPTSRSTCGSPPTAVASGLRRARRGAGCCTDRHRCAGREARDPVTPLATARAGVV